MTAITVPAALASTMPVTSPLPPVASHVTTDLQGVTCSLVSVSVPMTAWVYVQPDDKIAATTNAVARMTPDGVHASCQLKHGGASYTLTACRRTGRRRCCSILYGGRCRGSARLDSCCRSR